MNNIQNFETKQEYDETDKTYPNVSLCKDVNQLYLCENVEIITVSVYMIGISFPPCIGYQIGDYVTTIEGEPNMTWREWLNSKYSKYDDGSYYRINENTETFFDYITPAGFAECGFGIHSLDETLLEYNHSFID